VRLFVVPPRTDPTLEVAATGWQVLDLERAYAARILGTAPLAAAVAAAATDARRRMLLQAAAELLDAPAPQTRLRAAGAAYAGSCDPTSGLQLRLDDLELTAGTTERLADVLALPADRSPFALEIEAAVQTASGAERVMVWLERDQQLPAAVALVERLSVSGRVEVAGAFAAEHWRVLSSRPPLSAATLAEEPPLRRTLAGLRGDIGVGAGGLAWRAAPGDPVPEGDWAGHVALGELADRALDLRRCRFAVAAFCAIEDTVVAPEGRCLTPASLASARPARLLGEWQVGAPGIGRPELELTVAAQERGPIFDWVAGLRRFHWPLGRPGGSWAGREVAVGEPPADLDLARFRPFTCPGTLAADELDAVMEDLWRRLDARAPVVAGRVAEAFASPQPPAAGGHRVELDPDCALVEMPGEDGSMRWTAINLRTGVALALDARLATRVARLRRPVDSDAALAGLPAPVRDRALGMLRSRAVIRSCA
jgi:hypothetical protein